MPRSIPTPPEYAQHPELALVSLLYMLSRQHATGCRTMAESITAHFRFVAGDARYADVLRNAWAWSGRACSMRRTTMAACIDLLR